MSRLKIDAEARCDLRRIYDYIARGNPAAAERTLDDIRDRFRLLMKFPDVGESVEHLGTGIRRFSVGSYGIYFRKQQATVEIVRVLHAAQDANSQFE